MYLVYHPEGQEEPTRWRYVPQKLMSAEREMLERRTERTFAQFTKDVLEGSSVCRRALLFMFMKRDHAGKIKYEDVDFAWDELTLEFSKSEYALMIADASANLSGEQLAAVVEKLEQEAESAHDDSEHSGKALPPIAG